MLQFLDCLKLQQEIKNSKGRAYTSFEMLV